jgi:hypothetical protein
MCHPKAQQSMTDFRQFARWDKMHNSVFIILGRSTDEGILHSPNRRGVATHFFFPNMTLAYALVARTLFAKNKKMSDVNIVVNWKSVALTSPDDVSAKEACVRAVQLLCSKPCEIQLRYSHGLCDATVFCRVKINAAELEEAVNLTIQQNERIQAYEHIRASKQAIKQLKTSYRQMYPDAPPSSDGERGRSSSPVRPVPTSDPGGRPTRRSTRSALRRNVIRSSSSSSDDDNNKTPIRGRSTRRRAEQVPMEDFIVGDHEPISSEHSREEEAMKDKTPPRPAANGSQLVKYYNDFGRFAKNTKWIRSDEQYLKTWKKNRFLKKAFKLMLQVWQHGANPAHTKEALWDWITRQRSEPTWHELHRIRPVQPGRCGACQSARNVSMRLVPDIHKPEDNTETWGSCCSAGMRAVFDFLHWIGQMINDQRDNVPDDEVWWLDLVGRLDEMQTFLSKK